MAHQGLQRIEALGARQQLVEDGGLDVVALGRARPVRVEVGDLFAPVQAGVGEGGDEGPLHVVPSGAMEMGW